MVEKRADILAKATHVSFVPGLKARATGVVRATSHFALHRPSLQGGISTASMCEYRSFLRQDAKACERKSEQKR
jgi:hypothetical protein